ncbi:MAG: 2TM domain-containing protein [Myxococcota bacterium]
MSSAYSDEEVREILRRALERGAEAEGQLTHEELAAAAAEVGVAPERFEAAAAEVRAQRAERELLEEGQAIALTKRRRKTRAFWQHFGTYAIINGFLFGIDMLSGGGTWWYWPAMGWGVGVAMQALGLFTDGAASDEELRRLALKRRKRLAKKQALDDEARKRRRRKERVQTAEQRFEAAVEKGVAALLQVAAKGIETALDERGQAADTRFGRYVAQEKGQPMRAPGYAPPETPATPPTRVAPGAPAEVAVEVPATPPRRAEHER